MRRKKSKTIKFHGNDGLPIVSGTPMSTLTRYYYTNKPRFKHKKKPISMIKALEVRDRIYHNQERVNIKNGMFAKNFNYSIDKFYDQKEWEHHRDKVILNNLLIEKEI